MHKLIVTDLPALRTALRHESRSGAAQQHLHQLHCVYLVALGHSCAEVAAWFGDSPRSLQRWVTACVQGGVAGVSRTRPPGRPPRLSRTAMQALVQELAQPPGLCGFAQPQWDGRLLQRHLSGRYGVSISLRQCQRTLHTLSANKAA